MKRSLVTVVLSLLASLYSTESLNAGLNAPINLDNPRVVPILHLWNSEATLFAGGSGYLYSSRIVFTAAHGNYSFDKDGNRYLKEPPVIMVGRPNSSAANLGGRVKVVKTFVGDYKAGKNFGGLNDFIVYVLEKDLVSIKSSKLLTAEIERKLVESKAEVAFHGYGEYRNRCMPDEKTPCIRQWDDPNYRTSEFPRESVLNLAPLSAFSWIPQQARAELGVEVLISNHNACPGDSGGPITTIYENEDIYLGQGLNGAYVYACGLGVTKAQENDEQSFGWFSPVHKHMDLIAQAEDFVAKQIAIENSFQSETKTSAKLGSKCLKKNQVITSGKTKLTCVPNKKNLTWQIKNPPPRR